MAGSGSAKSEGWMVITGSAAVVRVTAGSSSSGGGDGESGGGDVVFMDPPEMVGQPRPSLAEERRWDMNARAERQRARKKDKAPPSPRRLPYGRGRRPTRTHRHNSLPDGAGRGTHLTRATLRRTSPTKPLADASIIENSFNFVKGFWHEFSKSLQTGW